MYLKIIISLFTTIILVNLYDATLSQKGPYDFKPHSDDIKELSEKFILDNTKSKKPQYSHIKPPYAVDSKLDNDTTSSYGDYYYNSLLKQHNFTYVLDSFNLNIGFLGFWCFGVLG